MIADKITIKQVPDLNATLTGLSRYNRSKMPGTFDWLQAAQGPDGRYITGLDEEGMEINLIQDPIEKEARKKEVKELRDYLEKRTGKDLSATSTFWEDFGVELLSDSDLVLNKSTPLHNVIYYMLSANRYIAPSEEMSGDPKYVSSKYYAYLHEHVKKQSVSNRKLKGKVEAKLNEISEKGKDYMVLLGQYLDGKKYHPRLSEDELYTMLGEYIDEGSDNATKFLKATEKSIEELQFKIIVNKAVRSNIIKYNNGLYQRGQVTLGRNIDELYNNLNSPEFAIELLSIKEEVESK